MLSSKLQIISHMSMDNRNTGDIDVNYVASQF